MTPTHRRPEALDDWDNLASTLGLRDVDLMLVGDGSGTVYTAPAGWACVAYDRRKQQALLHVGAGSGATNHAAELFPYVQALGYHGQDYAQVPPTSVRVGIVSDSELTVRCGNGRYARRANGCFWATLEWFEQSGYVLEWRHVPRCSNAWNRLADAVAGAIRVVLATKAAELRDAYRNGADWTHLGVTDPPGIAKMLEMKRV